MIDCFFLHSSDNPGIVLVNQTLTESNYSSWRRAMFIALSAKNKFGFVDGSIPMSPVDDPMRPLWQCNNIVCSWLLNSISKDLTASVIYSNTAAAIWQDLENRFKQQNGPILFQLRKALTNCAQGSSSVTQYFTKLKSIWEELSEFTPEHTCTCNGVQPLLDHIQREYVLTFLMGLNDSYSQLRGQILVMKPIPSITECFALLVQEEKQREVSGVAATPESQLAFAIQALVNANVKPKGGKKKDRPIYSHCSLVGHTKEKCYKIIGYPPGYQKGKSVNNVETVAAQSENSGYTEHAAASTTCGLHSGSNGQIHCCFI